MKAGWEKKKLGDVCELINRGIAPKYIDEGGVQVLNQKCIRDHSVSYELARRNNPELKSVPEERLIRVGDVLVNSTGTGTLGRVAQVREMPSELTTVDTHVTIVRPKEGMFYLDFFGYALIEIEEEIKNSGAGASGQTELARDVLKNEFTISFPESLEEQQRIVAILDEAFAGIATATANADKNLKNARELFESTLQSVFATKGEGWFETAVGEQITLQRGFDITKRQQNPGSVPVVSSGGIKSYHDKAMAKSPGVVIGRKGSLGTVYFLEKDYWPHDTTLWVKEFNNNHPKIVYYLFKGLDVSHLDSGAANPALNRNMVHPIQVSWPSQEIQDKVIQKLDALAEDVEKLESVYKEKLNLLSELKQSILQKTFAGELH